MTANAGYHAYATGDVLTAAQVQYNLQNQTVMYFATTTARDAALTGAILVEGMVSYTPATGVMYYNGTAWTAVGSVSPLTTKGDLYSYSTTNARLPVGSDGQTLVANSSQTTGLGWSATPSASNPLINAGFQIWQRGTSFTPTGTIEAYCADRWLMYTNAGTSYTYSRQLTNDTTNLPNIQYCVRIQRTSGNTSLGSSTLQQPMETVNTIPFAGKTVTFSFYARAGANYSATSNVLNVAFYGGTGTDQTPQSYTGSTAMLASTATLTTTLQRFTYTFAVGSTIKEMSPYIYNVPTGTAGTNDYYEITGMQIDIGSVALPFRTFSQTLQGELAACQRYYWRAGGDSSQQNFGLGSGTAATTAFIQVLNPVTLRTKPTAVEYSTLAIWDGVNGQITVTSLTLSSNENATNMTTLTATVASGVTTYRPYKLNAASSSSGYLGFSAEL